MRDGRGDPVDAGDTVLARRLWRKQSCRVASRIVRAASTRACRVDTRIDDWVVVAQPGVHTSVNAARTSACATRFP